MASKLPNAAIEPLGCVEQRRSPGIRLASALASAWHQRICTDLHNWDGLPQRGSGRGSRPSLRGEDPLQRGIHPKTGGGRRPWRLRRPLSTAGRHQGTAVGLRHRRGGHQIGTGPGPRLSPPSGHRPGGNVRQRRDHQRCPTSVLSRLHSYGQTQSRRDGGSGGGHRRRLPPERLRSAGGRNG